MMDPIIMDVRDTLDSGDAKKALKKCVAALETEENPMLLALKSLILLRLNRRTAAYDAAADAQIRLTDDFSSLELLVGVFTDLRKYSNVAELFKKLFQASPTREIGEKLFDAYSPDFEFMKQQELTMDLFKRFEAVEYAIRTAECALLTAKADHRHARMAEIAERLLNKLIRNEDFQCSEPFLRVFVLTLTETTQYMEAIRLLTEHSAFMPNFIERQMILANLYRKQGDGLSALNCYHEILKLNLSEITARPMWSVYVAYLDTLFSLVSDCVQNTTPYNPDAVLDPSLHQVKTIDVSAKSNFFRQIPEIEPILALVAMVLGNIKKVKDAVEGAGRAIKQAKKEGHLAELEFKRRLVYLGFPQGPEDYKSDIDPGNIFFPLVFRYATTQYEHDSAAEDLIPYIKLLNVSQLAPFKNKMFEYFTQMNEMSTNKLRQLKCYVNGIKVLRLMGCFSPPFIKHHGLLWDFVKRLQEKYAEALLLEAIPTQGEVRIADELLLLACEILLQPQISPVLDPTEVKNCEFSLHQFEAESGFQLSHRLLHCIGLLEFALRNSPFNAKLKLALVDLYVRMGSLETAHRLFLSLDLAPAEFDQAGHLLYGPLHDFFPFLNELEPLSKRVLRYHETYRETQIPSVKEAYNKHMLEELLELRKRCGKQDWSLFAFLAQVSILELDIFRAMSLPPPEVTRTLQDSADLINTMCNFKGGNDGFESMADDSISFFVGVVPVQTLVYKSTKAKYDLADLTLGNRTFVRRERIIPVYGWKGEFRAVALKGTMLKLFFDAAQGNAEVLNADLRDLASLLDDMGLLQNPAKLAKIEKTEEGVVSTKEAARKAREELQSGEGFYTGVFDTEESFRAHKKKVSILTNKFQLMLFEGEWRVLRGHSSHRPETNLSARSSTLLELDPILKLTEWFHVSRHFEVLEMMFKDIIEALIPKEDLFQAQKSKPGEGPWDQGILVPMHSGMIGVMAECIAGPFLSLMFLQAIYFQACNAAGNHLLDNPDPAEVENIRFQIRKMYLEIYRELEFLQRYLEAQASVCLIVDKAQEIFLLEAFQSYSLCGGLESGLYAKIVESVRQSHEWSIRALIDVLSALLRLPRS